MAATPCVRVRIRRSLALACYVTLVIVFLAIAGPLSAQRAAAAGTMGVNDYPNQDAVCYTGQQNGTYCPGYNWGYWNANHTAFSALSSRGFGYKNCTDFVAWRENLTWAMFKFPSGKGNAADWEAYASNAGLSVTHSPSVGDIAWWSAIPTNSYGHVAVVTAVNHSNNTVTVEEYNYAGTGLYTNTRSNVTAGAYLHPGTPPQGGGGSGSGTLYFIKTKNTGSGHVEIHSATPSSGYKSGIHAVTWFSPSDANSGWFQMVGTDLYFVKTKNTGSGRVEVHSATAASGYQSGVHYASAFSSGDANNGWFQMVGTDLYFIKTTNTGSGRVEIFRASASSGYSQVTLATPTAFSPADASNGWFQVQGTDLVFIKTKNTGSGRVEYFRSSASSNYQQVVLATPTAFSPSDANNGWFSTEDVNGDGVADLVFIKTKNTGSGQVELFIADGSRNYQQITSANVTWLSPSDANNGWFQVDSKS